MKFYLLLLALCAFSDAATFTYSTSVSLDSTFLTSNANGMSYLQYFSGNTPITLQGGDVLTGTITFTNGSLHI